MQQTIFQLLPSVIQHMLSRLPFTLLNGLEEIRIRERRPLEVIARGESRFVTPKGMLADSHMEAYQPTREDCLQLLDLLTNHSVYSFEEELRRGFVTVAGGHRVGLAGRTVLEHGHVKHFRDITGFNIRIARECKDAGIVILPYLLDIPAGTIHHTLVVSPPLQGKTTLIRDLCRLLSYGDWRAKRGFKVGIVDERSEIAACVKGVPAFDVGPRTDVLDGCPKAEGMMMMIRSMSPDVLVVDEIGRSEDAYAIHEALHAGIRVIATAHGAGLEDAQKRPIMRQLLADRVFQRIVIIRKSAEGFKYHVFNEEGTCVTEQTSGAKVSGRYA